MGLMKYNKFFLQNSPQISSDSSIYMWTGPQLVASLTYDS